MTDKDEVMPFQRALVQSKQNAPGQKLNFLCLFYFSHWKNLYYLPVPELNKEHLPLTMPLSRPITMSKTDTLSRVSHKFWNCQKANPALVFALLWWVAYVKILTLSRKGQNFYRHSFPIWIALYIDPVVFFIW